MNRLNVVLTVLLVVSLAAVLPSVTIQKATSQQNVIRQNNVLARQAGILAGRIRARPKEMPVSGGVMTAYLEALAARTAGGAGTASRASRVPGPAGANTGTLGCHNVFTGTHNNIRVNQDCSLRRQAEESIAVNPNNSLHLVAGQNDSRIGFNHCGVDFSFNRGRVWGDQVPPFWQFQLLDGRTTDACSDPTNVFDADGNAYFGGIIFNVAAAANAIVVAKSNAAFGGTFYHTPDSTLSFQEYRDIPLGVIANDNDPNIFNDKELMASDTGAGSLKKNYLYMTWTRFNAATGAGVGANSPIYFSQSTDGGRTWSAGIEISGANPAICTIFSGSANPAACDQDQGSMPFVDAGGNVYVAFGNGNTPLSGINQVLIVKCPVGLPCTTAANWSAPVKVGDLIGTHPIGPDSATGCPAGRQCLPPNGYRVPEFTSISGSVNNLSGRVFVTWADFRNGDDPGSTCGPLIPATSATPPCDNDVFMAYSDTGGATWSATINVSDMAGDDNSTAQWQPWSATGPDGRLYIAYYDRKYGTCEFTGCNDITLARSTNNGASFTYTRITTASMPNLVPANNPIQAGFLGDYMGVAATAGRAHIVWADTRPRPGFTNPEEDIYYATGP